MRLGLPGLGAGDTMYYAMTCLALVCSVFEVVRRVNPNSSHHKKKVFLSIFWYDYEMMDN